jgi:hypothetical protein
MSRMIAQNIQPRRSQGMSLNDLMNMQQAQQNRKLGDQQGQINDMNIDALKRAEQDELAARDFEAKIQAAFRDSTDPQELSRRLTELDPTGGLLNNFVTAQRERIKSTMTPIAGLAAYALNADTPEEAARIWSRAGQLVGQNQGAMQIVQGIDPTNKADLQSVLGMVRDAEKVLEGMAPIEVTGGASLMTPGGETLGTAPRVADPTDTTGERDFQSDYKRMLTAEGIGPSAILEREFKRQWTAQKDLLSPEALAQKVEIARAGAQVTSDSARQTRADIREEDIAAEARRPSTAGEKKALTFHDRMQNSITNLEKLDEWVLGMSLVDMARLRAAPNFLQTENGQLQLQAEREFTEARLRKDSGAAVPPYEYENDKLTYFPQPGDTPGVIAQKKASRQVALEAIRNEAGPAYAEKYGKIASSDDVQNYANDQGLPLEEARRMFEAEGFTVRD